MNSSHPKVLNALAGALKRHLGAVEKSKIEIFVNGGQDAGATNSEPIVFVRSSKLPIRFFCHFSPDADLLLHDRVGGTFALIRILDGLSPGGDPASDDPPSQKSISKIVEDAVGQATYLRHLFLTSPATEFTGDRDGETPLTVELVIVVPKDAEKLHQEVGTAFRRIAAVSSSLENVGLNLLHYRMSGAKTIFEKESLQYAFPWLLTATSEWFDSLNPANRRDAGNGRLGRLAQIILQNYRLPGRRILKFDKDSRIHLVYGRNGSGKSSLAEALELALTGRIDNIRPEENEAEQALDYVKIIKNNRSAEQEPAVIELLISELVEPAAGENLKKEFTIVKEGLKPFPEDRLRYRTASSFRLNQRIMDEIVMRSPELLGHALQNAFFQDELEKDEQFRSAERKWNETRRVLSDLVKKFDIAEPIVRELMGRQARGRPPIGDFHSTLRRWLEARAAADLLKKRSQIVEVVQRCGEFREYPSENIVFRDADGLSVQSEENAERIRANFEKWEERKETLSEQLNRIISGMPGGEGKESEIRSSLDDYEVEALDELGRTIISDSESADLKPLGQFLRNLIADDKPGTYGPIPFGTKADFSEVFNRISEFRSRFNELTFFASPPSWLGSDPRIEEARKRAKALLDLSKSAEALLVRRIGQSGVKYALNEMLALFTPARWAYRRLDFKEEEKETGPGWKLMIQEPDGTELEAFHRLNTGELNLLALVLFLLFTRRVDNPLRLLVLDDPLQNLDELTVTAVACGLQKLVFKFNSEVEDWRFLILLHSEADLNRISSLIPGTVYLLPWLSPAEREGEDPLEIKLDQKRSNQKRRPQSLEGIVEQSKQVLAQ